MHCFRMLLHAAVRCIMATVVDLIQTPAILAHPKLVELAENTVMDTYTCTSPRAI